MRQHTLPLNQFSNLLDYRIWVIPVLLSIILIFSSFSSYLLFHTLAELFAITVGVMMFVVAFYTYPYARDSFMMYLAIGFFWVAGLDTVHALIYKGMGIYSIDSANHSTQFWIASRFFEAIILLVAPLFLKRHFQVILTYGLFGLIAFLFYILIMDGDFPDTFIEGKGLTPFKIYSEYVICAVLTLALINLHYHREKLKAGIYPFLFVAIVLTIISELAFTLYTDVYGITNLVGHIFKLFSFWLIFYSIIHLCLMQPYEALKTATSLLTNIRDSIPDLIFYKNEVGVYLGCNQAFCDLVGKKNEMEIVGITDYELFDPELADFFRVKDAEMLEKNMPKRNDEWVTYPDGRKVQLDTLKTPFLDAEGHVIGILGISRDVTERKRLEEENRSQILHLESMQKIADAVSSSLTPDEMLSSAIVVTREIFESDRAWLMYPCDVESKFWGVPVQSVSSEYTEPFNLDDRFPMNGAMKQIINEALGSIVPISYCPMPNEGQDTHQFAEGSRMMVAIKPRFGQPWLFGLHQCSHDREWTAEEKHLFQNVGIRISDILSSVYLNRDLQKLSQAVEQAGEAVMITDRNAVIEYVNPAFTAITGYEPEEIIGKNPAVLKSTAQDPVFYKELWDTITSGKVWHGTLIDKRKDGSFYPALMSVAPIYNDSGSTTHYVSLQQDMTDYKKMEGQFLQAQKMEAIGTLVGGIAHDFNNMLAAIQGNVYLSKRALKNQPEVVDKLDSIEELGSRAAEMVKQLLTFARKDRVQMHPMSLNDFIKDAYKLAKAAIPENIELICDYCEEDLMVQADTTQLQQALMNLLNNARDAVEGCVQPQICCVLRPFVATEQFKKAHPELRGEHFSRLEIKDNGEGISREHLNKIFEPFFTTKNVGKGTGLGLAMVYGAVQSHGGALEVVSEAKQGSTFTIYLPLKEGEDEQIAQDQGAVVEGNGQLILLVDDENSMRETTSEVLESLGYKVLTAADGQEALTLFTAQQQDIKLILTDIVMPQVGGVDLAKSVRLLNKSVPIIFTTGYDMQQAIESMEDIEHCQVIHKPFSFEELSQLMVKLLK